MALQIRRGTNAERLLITPLAGEIVYTTDTKELWIGDGTTLGGVPAVPAEQALDVVGPALENGTHYNITFTYDDAAGTIDASVSTKLSDDTDPALGGNLSSNGYDIIEAGNVTANSINSPTITAQDFVGSSLLVGGITTYSISPASGASSILINSPISAPSINSNFVGSLYSDDSTTIVDGLTGNIYANNLAIGNVASANATFSIYNNNQESLIINKTGAQPASVVFKNTAVLGDNIEVGANSTLGSVKFETWLENLYLPIVKIEALAATELNNGLQGGLFKVETSSATTPYANTLTFDQQGVLTAKVINTGSIPDLTSISYAQPGAIVFDSNSSKFVGCTAAAVGVNGDPEYVAPTWVELSSPQLVATTYQTIVDRDEALPTPTPGTIIYIAENGRFQGFVDRDDSTVGYWVDLAI